MRRFGRGGVTVQAPGASFPPASGPLLGNQLPPQLGYSYDLPPDKPGPHPASQPLGGQVGHFDGASGSDPSRAKVQPFPRRIVPTVEGGAAAGAGPALGGVMPAAGVNPRGYAGGVVNINDATNNNAGWAGRLGPNGDPEPDGRQSFWRGGIQGFNDKLTVKDRHAYWDTGYQRTGLQGFPPAGSPNTYNDPVNQPPTAELRTLNRTVSYQKGTDTTAFQDDLSRPYTWLGEQGSGWTPIPGGVPGLYQPYGSRGGVPYPIVDPTGGQGGRQLVWSGPPHGLHSLTYPDRGDTLNRYEVNPQMAPVRLDRPSNSPIAGQSYSQTVQYQGTTQGAAQRGGASHRGGHPAGAQGRGWAGARRPGGRRG